MTTVVGGISVYLEDDTSRFSSSMRANAAMVEQQSQRMSKALGGTADSVDKLHNRVRTFEPDAFKILATSALRAESSVKRLELSVFALGAALGGGFAGAAASRALAKYADEFTTVRNRIKAVVEDRAGQVQTEQELFDLATKTRSSIESTVSLYARIRTASPELAANQTELLRVIETVQKSVQIGGASTQEAASVATQLSQALGSGRLQGDELRSILENNIPLARILARELAGGNIGALREMGSNGELTTDRVVKAILAGSKEIDDTFSRTQIRISDAFTQLNNALVRYVGTADQSLGVSAALANGLVKLAENFQNVGDAAVTFGAALAGIFVGRRLAGLINGPLAAIQRVQVVANEQRAAAKEAAEKAAQELENAKINTLAQREKLDAFGGQSPSAQGGTAAARARANAVEGLQKAQKRLNDLVQAEADAYKKVAEAQAEPAKAATREMRQRDAAIRNAEEAEKRLAAAIADRNKKNAAFNAAGGGVRRSELNSLYGALFNEAEARRQFDSARSQLQELATIRTNLKRDAAAALKEGGQSGLENFSGLQQQISLVNQKMKDVYQQRIIAGGNLRKAEAATAAEEAQLATRQLNEKERAAAALARADANVVANQTVVQKARETIAKRNQQIVDAEVAAEEQKQRRVQTAQQNADKVAKQRDAAAVNVVDQALNVRATTQAQAERGAATQARLSEGVAKAVAAEAEALERVTVAQRAYGVAQAAAREGSVVLRAAVSSLGSAWTYTLAALGGPVGAALAAAGAAFTIYEVQTLKAKIAAEEYQRTLETLANSLQKVNAAVQGNTVDRSLQAEVSAIQGKLRAGLAAKSNELAGDVSLSVGVFGPLSGYFDKVLGQFQKLSRSPDGTIAANKELDNFIGILDEISAKDIKVANKIDPIRQLAIAIRDEGRKIKEYESQIAPALFQDPRELRDAASARFAAEAAGRVQSQLRLPSQTPDEATLETQDPTLRALRATGILQQRIVEQNYTALEAKIAAEEAKLRDLLAKGGVGEGDERIKEVARANVAAALREVYDLNKAVDDAGTAMQRLQELAGAGPGAALQQQVGQVTLLVNQMGQSINEKAVEISQSFSLLLSGIQGNSSVSADAIRKLASDIGTMGSEGKVSEDKVRALISALEALSGSNPNLSGAIAQMLALARSALTAIGAVNGLKSALGGVGDKAVENTIQGMVGVPGEAPVPDFIKKQKADDIVARAAQKGKSRRDRALDVQDANPGFFTLSEAEKIADRVIAAEESKKGGGGKKSDEQKFEDKVRRLVETGKAAFFTESDRALIQKLEELKADPNLIKATNAAIKAGQPIPAQAKQVQDALELKKAGDAYNEIVTKYGTLEQIAPRLAEKQRILNIAVKEGGLSAEQAGLAFADYLTQFNNYKWIDQLSSAVGDLASVWLDVADGTTTAEDAMKRFAKRVAQIAIDTLITEPLKNSLKSFLAGIVGNQASSGGGGGFGGILSSLFGGIFGGGSRAVGPGTATLFHSGGLVGLEGAVRRLPHFHSGLNSKEYLSVLERGERVLTASQDRRTTGLIAGLSAMSAGGRGDVIVNNYGDATVKTRQTGRGTEIDIDAAFDEQVARSFQRGALGRHLSGMGVNRFNGR